VGARIEAANPPRRTEMILVTSRRAGAWLMAVVSTLGSISLASERNPSFFLMATCAAVCIWWLGRDWNGRRRHREGEAGQPH